MLFEFLAALGFRDLSVSLNAVPGGEERSLFSEALRAHAAPFAGRLGGDDQRRLSENPLRLFDSKDPETAKILKDAPRAIDFLDAESRRHHAEVAALLGEHGIRHREDPRLVRGLDYYTKTVFEVTSADLGAQDAILGGGRYDRLVEDLGGPPLSAVGFAIGEDRLVDVMPARPAPGGAGSGDTARGGAGSLRASGRRPSAIQVGAGRMRSLPERRQAGALGRGGSRLRRGGDRRSGRGPRPDRDGEEPQEPGAAHGGLGGARAMTRAAAGRLTAADEGRRVLLQGWIAHRRDFGELVFATVRERSGVVQVLFAEDAERTLVEQAKTPGRGRRRDRGHRPPPRGRPGEP
jgi:hypothetical protein